MRVFKLLLPLFLLSATTLVAAPPLNILLLNDQCNASVAYYPTALNNLGHAFTEITDPEELYAQLTNGTDWDLVLIDCYSDHIPGPALLALEQYIINGGRCVLNYWRLDWSLAAAFGADMYNSPGCRYETPIPLNKWDLSSPSLFTTPNAVPDLTPVRDTCDVDGYRVNPFDDAEAVAGYTPAESPYEAGIVIGNEGRTILLGITPGLFGDDMELLLENCIEYVFPPAPKLRLTLSSLAPAAGGPFTLDADVQPLADRFDAWGVILGPNNVSYSFVLGNPTALATGARALATNVPGLPAPFSGRLFQIDSIPASAAGVYTIIVELVPAGLPPFEPIDGYSSSKTVTVTTP